MVEILNTDRYLQTHLENSIPPCNERIDVASGVVSDFIDSDQKKDMIEYDSYSRIPLTIQNKQEYKKDIVLDIFRISLELNKPRRSKYYTKIENVGYYALKVKTMFELYLFINTDEELKDEFEKHEIIFMRNCAEVETSKVEYLIAMLCGNGCRITDNRPQEKYNQTNYGNRYALLYHCVTESESRNYERSDFNFREALGGIISISTMEIRHLLSIYFLKKPYQKDDEIIYFEEPTSLLDILEMYIPECTEYYKFKKVKVKIDDKEPIVLKSIDVLRGSKYFYAPLSEWRNYHMDQINVSKDIDIIISTLQEKYMHQITGVPHYDKVSYDSRGDKSKEKARKRKEMSKHINEEVKLYEHV